MSPLGPFPLLLLLLFIIPQLNYLRPGPAQVRPIGLNLPLKIFHQYFSLRAWFGQIYTAQFWIPIICDGTFCRIRFKQRQFE